MPDTVDKVAHQLLLHNSLAGRPLALLWAANALSKLTDAAEWSWRTRYGEFVLPDVYVTGTVTIASTDPTLLVGVGTTWTPEMVGRQFRVGTSFGYDLVEWIDATHMRIAMPWGDQFPTAAGYMIYQQYVTVPADFGYFISVIDPVRNYKLRTGIERRELDRRDARRTITGIPYVIAEAGYATTVGSEPNGNVDATPVQAAGTAGDPSPYFAGPYAGSVDAVFVVEITTGGASGTAVFRWKKDNGAYTTGVTSSDSGTALADGVVVYFPTGFTYVLSDVFVVRASAAPQLGNPRFEIWPTQLTRTYFPFYYVALTPDWTVPTATLPRGIRPDVVLRGAMSDYRAWPGRGAEAPNPLYDRAQSLADLKSFLAEVDVLALRDDELFPRQVSYYRDLPFAGPPWDSSWEQRHQ